MIRWFFIILSEEVKCFQLTEKKRDGKLVLSGQMHMYLAAEVVSFIKLFKDPIPDTMLIYLSSL